MLVVSRKKGESLVIGDNIEITISSLSDNNVKICIDAPREVRILRKELINEIKDENKQSLNKKELLLKALRNKK